MADNGHVVLIGIGAITGALGFVKLVRLRRILRNKAVATGTIVGTKLSAWHRYDDEADAQLTIRFQASDRTYEFIEKLRPPLWQRHTEASVNAHKGRQLKVFYDVRNPDRAMAYMRRHSTATATYLGVAVLALGAVAIYGEDVNNVSFTPLYEWIKGWFG